MSSLVSVTGSGPPRNAAEVLRIGRWRVDASADEIHADGQVVKLEPLQMRLLLALAAQPGQVVTTQALLDEVWRDLVVTPNSVYQAVAQLRRQLGDSADAPAHIQTVHRKGYRLVAAVSIEAAPAPAEAPAAALPSPRRERRRVLALSALAAIGTIGAGAAWWSRPRSGTAVTVRLAVLPFTDRSAGGTEQALARGLAQDVARALGQRAELQVIAPDGLLGLDPGAEGDVAALAQRLGVQALLQGELARTGPLLRVSAQLRTTGQAGPPAWQQTFEQAANQASRLPASIAQQVGAALALAPLPAAPAGTGVASEAYELYVLGNDAWRPKTTEAFAKARTYFQRGIDADPAYARNYVGLGWTWLGQATSGAGLDLPRAVALATPLFERALRLDPAAPEALTGQATLHRFAGEDERARELLQRALALQPSYAQAHLTLGIVEFDRGWPLRALPHFERAAALSPLSATQPERLALAQLFAGRGDAALASARSAVALEPAYPNGHWMLGVAGYAMGDLAQAVGGYREALEREPRRPYLWHELARLYLDLERPDEAAAAFARSVEQLPGTRWPAVHAALAWLVRESRGGDVPAALERVPEDGSVCEWALMRLMAGLPVDATALQRALDTAAARGESLAPAPWFVFQGSHRLLDLAISLSVLGQRAQAEQHLDTVLAQLDTLERQGNRWHMLAFHRARVLALRGQRKGALDALDAAVRGGSRRAWWLRLDPAFASLRGEPRFGVLQGDIGARVAAQRRQIGF
jgi:DNA-binding winged helix-turn-helix (wHTH) protein/tetratricopeptide (TPR) repeat protein